MITAIEHIALNCRDYQTSLAFYCDILGFTCLETVSLDDFNITYLAAPNGIRLELFDYVGNNRDIKREESDVGLRHLAFQVDDVAAEERRLRAAGVEIILPTTELPALKVRVLLLLDPNGITLEFCEPLQV